jgi:hypothetical protein
MKRVSLACWIRQQAAGTQNLPLVNLANRRRTHLVIYRFPGSSFKIWMPWISAHECHYGGPHKIVQSTLFEMDCHNGSVILKRTENHKKIPSVRWSLFKYSLLLFKYSIWFGGKIKEKKKKYRRTFKGKFYTHK